MGIIDPTNPSPEGPVQPEAPDLDAIERMYKGHNIPQLHAGLDGKLRPKGKVTKKTAEEIEADERREKADRKQAAARGALVRAMAREEGEWLKKHVGKVIPSLTYAHCHKKAMAGDDFDLRKLMNEHEVKIQQVNHPDLAEDDRLNGIVRRHWQVLRAGKVVFEHMWEWTQEHAK